MEYPVLWGMMEDTVGWPFLHTADQDYVGTSSPEIILTIWI